MQAGDSFGTLPSSGMTWDLGGIAAPVIDPESNVVKARALDTAPTVSESWWTGRTGAWVSAASTCTVLLRRQQVWRMYLATPRVITYDETTGTLSLAPPRSLPDDPLGWVRYPTSWSIQSGFAPTQISYIDSPDGGLSFPVQAPQVSAVYDLSTLAMTGWDTTRPDWSEAGWGRTPIVGCSTTDTWYSAPSVVDVEEIVEGAASFLMSALARPASRSTDPRCNSGRLPRADAATPNLPGTSSVTLFWSNDADFGMYSQFDVLATPVNVVFGGPVLVAVPSDPPDPNQPTNITTAYVPRFRLYVPWTNTGGPAPSWVTSFYTLDGAYAPEPWVNPNDGVSIFEITYEDLTAARDSGATSLTPTYLGELAVTNGGASWSSVKDPSVAKVEGRWVLAWTATSSGSTTTLNRPILYFSDSADGLMFDTASAQWDVENLDDAPTSSARLWRPDLAVLCSEQVRVTCGVVRSGTPLDTDPPETFDGLLAVILPQAAVWPEQASCP